MTGYLVVEEENLRSFCCPHNQMVLDHSSDLVIFDNKKLKKLVEANKSEIMDAWNEHFKD
mgnify:CR=1 FL=1